MSDQRTSPEKFPPFSSAEINQDEKISHPKRDKKYTIPETEISTLERLDKIKYEAFAFASNTENLSPERLLKSKNKTALAFLHNSIGDLIDGQIYSCAPKHGGVNQFLRDVHRSVELLVTGEVDELTKFELENRFSEIRKLAANLKIDQATIELTALIGKSNYQVLERGFGQTLGGLLLAGMQSFCRDKLLLSDFSFGVVDAYQSFFSDISYVLMNPKFILNLDFLKENELQIKIVCEEVLSLNKPGKFHIPLARSKCLYIPTEKRGFQLKGFVTNGSHFVMQETGSYADMLKLLQIIAMHGELPLQEKIDLLKFLDILSGLLREDILRDEFHPEMTELYQKIKKTRDIQELRELIDNACPYLSRHFPVKIREWIAQRRTSIAKLFDFTLPNDRAINEWLDSLLAIEALETFKREADEAPMASYHSNVDLIKVGSGLIISTFSPYICSNGSITFVDKEDHKSVLTSKGVKDEISLIVEGGKITLNRNQRSLLFDIIRETPAISFSYEFLENVSLILPVLVFRNILSKYYEALMSKLSLLQEKYYLDIGGFDKTEIIITKKKQVYVDFVFPIKIKTIPKKETQFLVDEIHMRFEATMAGLQLRIVSENNVFMENALKDETMDAILETLQLPELKDLKTHKEKLCKFLDKNQEWLSLLSLLEPANTVSSMRHIF